MEEYLKLVVSVCRQNLQERFAGSYMGTVWVIIWPLVQLFIYIVIFGKLMGARLGIGNHVYSYGLYVAAGLLCWTTFAATLQRVSRVLVDKKHIISKVAVDLRVFPLAICLEEMLPFAAGLVLLVLADLFSGWLPEVHWLALALLALYCQQLLACGLGLFFACCAVFLRDIMEFVPICLQLGFWFTPIVYLPSILPQWLQDILWINPLTDITHIYQQCFVLGGEVNWGHVLYFVVFAHLSLVLGLVTHARLQKDIRDVL